MINLEYNIQRASLASVVDLVGRFSQGTRDGIKGIYDTVTKYSEEDRVKELEMYLQDVPDNLECIQKKLTIANFASLRPETLSKLVATIDLLETTRVGNNRGDGF